MKKALQAAFLLMTVISPVFSKSEGTNPENPFVMSIHFYRDHLSVSKGFHCPMYPSCSEYAEECFKKHDFVSATLLTVDRLGRCGFEPWNYRRILVHDSVRLYDPIESGDIGMYPDVSRNFFVSEKKSAPVNDFVSNTRMTEEEKWFEFSSYLQTRKEYDRALTEYQRFLFYFPESEKKWQVIKNILYCDYQLARYPELYEYAEWALSADFSQEDAGYVYLMTGLVRMKSEDLPKARKDLEKAYQSTNDHIRYHAAIFQGLSYVRVFDWQNADAFFKKIPADSALYGDAVKFSALTEKGKALPEKSPLLAGLLSIIPGLGYVYDGFPLTGLAALVVNGLLAWGSFEAFREGNYPLGYLVGTVGVSWYSGSIFGSVLTADKVNEKLKNDLAMEFRFEF